MQTDQKNVLRQKRVNIRFCNSYVTYRDPIVTRLHYNLRILGEMYLAFYLETCTLNEVKNIQ